MEAFDVLHSKWKEKLSDVNLQSLLDEKLSVLLKDPSERGVLSVFSLLRSFGVESFCHVLCVKDRQIGLCVDLGIIHPLLWEKKLLKYVSQDKSPWYELYESDAFSSMEFRVCGESDWSSLSDRLKSKIVKESLVTVSIPSGSFMMGALDRDKRASDNEKPCHQVILSKGFEMCIYTCTQGLYESVMGNNPSGFKGATRPVEKVS